MKNSELLERFRELEARLQKVNTELDGLRVAIKGRTFAEKKAETPTKVYEVGEYVRVKSYIKVKSYKDSGEFAGIVTNWTVTPRGFRYNVYGKDKTVVNLDADMIEKWFPKKGDLCIFWGNRVNISVLRIFSNLHFNEKAGALFYRDNWGDIWSHCIPFLSEKQFKEHIGYEN